MLKKVNEVVFGVGLGKEGALSFKEDSFFVKTLQNLISKLVFFDLQYLHELGRGV